MNIRQSTVAAAIAGAFAIGAAGQASASVYAGSSLDISGLSLNVSPTSGSTVVSYKFDLANSALLNGQSDTSAGLSASCGTSGSSSACSTSSPVLAANAANAPGSTVLRQDGGANNWTFLGPGANTYANSDSEITTAQLVQFPTPTSTKSISEAEIQGTGDGQSQTNVQSNTTFLFTFTLNAPGTLTLSFNADPDLYAAVSTPNLLTALAQANTTATFTLSGGGQSVTWSPNGLADGVFTACAGGLTCTENNDTQSLNNVIPWGALGSIGNPGSNGYSDNRYVGGSDAGATAFGITIGGLGTNAGLATYSLALVYTTSVSVAQQVPEPASLTLLGAGLIALRTLGRRKKQG